MANILIVTTGGTIESFYNPEEGTPYHVPQDAGSIIPEALEKMGAADGCQFLHLCQKDSKQVNSADLQAIATYMREQGFNNVVVVHGTDTMPQHARTLRVLLNKQGMQNTNIVFTGAMEPLRDKDKAWRLQSEGWDNLTLALQEAQRPSPRTMLAVERQLYDAFKTDKDVVVGDDNTVQSSGFVARKSHIPEVIEERASRNNGTSPGK
tara:strand:+ start:825 stop:1448 length:624 start_codon:yes stop_codon:yes gene_type:complete